METQDHDQQKLIDQYRAKVGTIPPRVPLEMRVISKRVFPYRDGYHLPDSGIHAYEEWKIEYVAEGAGTMPEPSQRRVPAYLLIPRGDAFRPPFPAMACFHQCSCDCGSGKEAVVGKHVDRSDQAYGYELVLQGFVVLAPDHYNCGERNVPAVRQQDQQIIGCFPAVSNATGRSNMRLAEALHAIRAVDLLESLDFVDAGRIGAIGHSMGTSAVVDGMASDVRIGIGITSGGGPELQQLACIAPRPFMQLQGLHDGGPKRAKDWERIHDIGKAWYAPKDCAEKLVLKVLPGGHVFLDEFKRDAYCELKRHFGMTEPKVRLSINELVQSVMPEGRATFCAEAEHFAIVSKQALVRALGGTFYALTEMLMPSTDMVVSISSTQNEVVIFVDLPGADNSVSIPHGYKLRDAEQVFHEHGGTLTHKVKAESVEYRIVIEMGE